MAVLLVVASVLMVVGFRRAPFVPVYDPPAWGIHLNNLLMLVRGRAVGRRALEGAGADVAAASDADGGGRLGGRAPAGQRRPRVAGAVRLAGALGGGRDAADQRARAGLGAAGAGDGCGRPAAGWPSALVVFAVIAAIHTWLGYWPFPQ